VFQDFNENYLSMRTADKENTFLRCELWLSHAECNCQLH